MKKINKVTTDILKSQKINDYIPDALYLNNYLALKFCLWSLILKNINGIGNTYMTYNIQVIIPVTLKFITLFPQQVS